MCMATFAKLLVGHAKHPYPLASPLKWDEQLPASQESLDSQQVRAMELVYTIRTAVGILGNVIAFGLFLSPLPTFIQIVSHKSTQQFSGVPYIATLLNCLLWVLYGLPFVTPRSTLVITINVIGTALELSYISIFVYYATPKARAKVLKMLAVVLTFCAAVALLVLTITHKPHTRSFIVGILCVLVCCGMYVAPMSIMRSVIKTNSVKYMPFMLSFTSFCNGVVWTAYGFLGKLDPFIVAPNGIGVLLAAFQLILYGIYYKKEDLVDEPAKADLETGKISDVALPDYINSVEPVKAGKVSEVALPTVKGVEPTRVVVDGKPSI